MGDPNPRSPGTTGSPGDASAGQQPLAPSPSPPTTTPFTQQETLPPEAVPSETRAAHATPLPPSAPQAASTATGDPHATRECLSTPAFLPEAAFTEGVRIEGYVLLGELGRGGMGVVYKARQVQLERLVALKMILAGGHAGPQERARFQAEARAVARLQHPNIVQ